MDHDLEGVVGPLPDEVALATTEGAQTDAAATEANDTQTGGADTAAGGEGKDATDEADSDATDAEDGEGDDNETRSQRRRRQRREYVERLERANADHERTIARLQGSLNQLQAPKADEYENQDDYIADRAAFAGEKAALERQIRDEQAASTEAAEARSHVRREAFTEAVEDARQRYADFDKVALGAHWEPTPIMREVMLESERSADLAYYLGSNPAEAAKIAALPPLQQAAAVARIEARLASPEKRTQTAAPPPLKPVKGAEQAGDKSPAEMTYEEYAAYRRKGSK